MPPTLQGADAGAPGPGTPIASFVGFEFRELPQNCSDLKLNLPQANGILQADSRRGRSPRSRVLTLDSWHRGFLKRRALRATTSQEYKPNEKILTRRIFFVTQPQLGCTLEL